MIQTTKVIGVPGSGKTSYLIDRVNDELESGLTPLDICFSSYTVAASKEAADRAMIRFRYTADSFKYFRTIHSICYRLLHLNKDNVFNSKRLKEFGEQFYYTFSSKDQPVDEEFEIREQMLQYLGDYFNHFDDWWKNTRLGFDEAFNRFMNEAIYLPDGWSKQRLEAFLEHKNEYKLKNGLWDFDDFLTGVLRDHECPPVKVLAVDEFQDNSPLMAEVVKQWASDCDRVYIAGDPDQALYGFIGADPSLLIDYPSDDVARLTQSHRVPVKPYKIAIDIISRNKKRFPHAEFLPKPEDGEVFKLWRQRIPWDDFVKEGVFYLHRTRWLLGQAYDELLAQGIPFYTNRGRQSPLATEKRRVILALLKLMDGEWITLSDIKKLSEYLSKPYIAYGKKTEIERQAKENPDKKVSKSALRVMGFTDAFFSHLNQREFIFPLRFKDNADRTRDYLSRLYMRYGRDVFEHEPSILLSTYHGVKGRQMPNVLLSPDQTRRVEEGYSMDRESENRVMYVGATRTERRLVVLRPESDRFFPMPEVT